MKKRKLLQKILNNPHNVRFGEAVIIRIVRFYAFENIGQSSHFHSSRKEVVNLQNVGGQAKSYQVRQFLKLVERHDLELKEK